MSNYSPTLIDLLQGMYDGRYTTPTGLDPIITDPDYTGNVPNPVLVETREGGYYQPPGVDFTKDLIENPDYYKAVGSLDRAFSENYVHPDFEEEFGYQALPAPNEEGNLSQMVADREYASLGPKDGAMSWITSGHHMPLPPTMEQSGNGWSNVNSETVPLNIPNPNEVLVKLQGSVGGLGANLKPLVPKTLGLGLNPLAMPRVPTKASVVPKSKPRVNRNNVYMGGLPPHMRKGHNGVYMGGLPPHMRG